MEHFRALKKTLDPSFRWDDGGLFYCRLKHYRHPSESWDPVSFVAYLKNYFL
jgi:hypothetical protein